MFWNTREGTARVCLVLELSYSLKNQKAGCPKGIPNDLYDMPVYYGREQCFKSADSDIWAHAMITDAPPLTICTAISFNVNCQKIVHTNFTIDLHSQVIAANAVNVYKLIANNI